jgi:tetratricopeptide (TPR) repeat protein
MARSLIALAAALCALGAVLLWRAPRPAPLEPDAARRDAVGEAPISGLRSETPPGFSAHEIPLHVPDPPPVGAEDRRSLFVRGRALHRAGEYEQALPYLATLHDLEPDHVGVCWLLASSYDHLSLAREAVELLPCLERADRDELRRVRPLVDSLRRSGLHEVEFQQAVSDHFMASYAPDGLGAASVGHILDVLERGRSDIYRRVGLAARRRITVVVYEEGQFGESTGAPHWARGFFDGKIRAPIAQMEQGEEHFDTMLIHEYVHAVLHERGGARIPAWVHEGLANLLARNELDARALEAQSRRRGLLGLDELTTGFQRLDAERVGLAYLQSYWMVRDLTTERGSAPWLALLDALERDPRLDFHDAFFEVMGETPYEYLSRWSDDREGVGRG